MTNGLRIDERKVVVVGAGGHSKVVIDTLRACGIDVSFILDDDADLEGSVVNGVVVRGSTEWLRLGPADEVDSVLAIGSNRARRTVAARLDENARWVSAVHPSTVVSPSARIHEGTVVFAHAVIQADARIGRHVVINTAATVDHDSRIQSYAHIGPGAHLAGNVTVGEGAQVGIGASVKPGVQIGAWATVGAGAAVVDAVPEGATVTGVPARAFRKR